jgi:archaellum component FlaG (FlaF/FlaG flagellin family)
MSKGASVFQLVMYAISMLIAAVEVGICTRWVIFFSQHATNKEFAHVWAWMIGGIIHGAILIVYFITL